MGGKIYKDGGKTDSTKRFLKTTTKKIQSPSTAANQDQTANVVNLDIKENMTDNFKNKDSQELGRRIYNTAYKSKYPVPERGFKGYGDVEGATKMETEDYYAEKRKEMGIDKIKTYRFGGKIYKDGGLALFKALKKKFGEG